MKKQNSNLNIQDEPLVAKPILKRVRSKSFSVNSDIQSGLLDEKEEMPKKKKNNWFIRSLKAVVKPIIRGVSAVAKPIAAGYLWFLNTKLGKLYQIVTSNAVVRTTAIVTCSLALAGITILGPVIPVGLAIAGLVSVGLKAAIDTYHVRSIRKLEKENNLLIKNRTNKNIQDYLLKLDPELQAALQEHLYIPKRDEQKKSVNTRYGSDPQSLWSRAKSVVKAFVQNTLEVTTNVVSAAGTANVAKIVQAGVGAVPGLVSDSIGRISLDDIRRQYKKQIDEERDKYDTPTYDNLRELKLDFQKQETQTKALQNLISSESYWMMSPKDKIAEFIKLKDKIEKQTAEERLKTKGNVLTRMIKNIGSVVKDVGISHNPFSKYNSLDKLKVEENIALTKIMELEQQNKNKRNELRKISSLNNLMYNEAQVEGHVSRVKNRNKSRRMSI